ncbi:MAG TPA: hypothetical protein DHW22_09595 [Planctomycetaceae bacterium]|nr:hypothetical protein [Planctomycetaceae bacterium]
MIHGVGCQAPGVRSGASHRCCQLPNQRLERKAMVKVKNNAATSKKRPQKQSDPGFLHKLLTPRPRVLIALCVVGLLGWGIQRTWQQVAPEVIHRDRYVLKEDRISISPLPEWITGDVRYEVIEQAGLERRLSILDTSFMQVVEDAFVLHPWVESVDRITKSYPPGVHVDLTYRRPIAVVEMASQQGVQFVPIDRYAVHLPAHDVPDIRRQYLPRIGGIVARPPAGQQWADERVTGAADLIVKMAEYWEKLHLVDVLPSARPELRGEHRFYVYDLISRGGTRIVWGPPPGENLPGEDSFQQKLDRLRQCIAEYGPLDSVRGPAEVNVRHELAIKLRTVKKPQAVKQAAKEHSEDAAVVK